MGTKCRTALTVVSLILTLCLGAAPALASSFVRGDVNQSGSVDLSDGIRVLMYLFRGEPAPLECLDAADLNDSGTVDVADAIYELGYLFAGGSAPAAPFPACGPDPTDDALACERFERCSGPFEEVRSDKERNLDPDVSEAELEALAAGNAAFAFDFYRAVRGESGNLFYSPFSISVALAMLYGGARGDTEAEMARALEFTLPQERLHPALNALDLEIQRRGQGAQGADGEGFRLNVANAIWGQIDYSFLSPFLDVLGENYGAGMRLLDFMFQPEPSRITINDWVSDATEGKIVDLIPPGAITEYTRLVLTNAIYFNAAWLFPFPEEMTRDGTFRLLDGGAVTASLMAGRAEFGYGSGDGYFAVELPYDGEELSMVIVVPELDRFGAFESSLDAAAVDAIVEGIEQSDIQLTMPKFRFESSFALVPTLQSMGMRQAFVPNVADLSGIDGTRSLYVSDVLHKAYVGVNEAGTEAAAATAVIVGTTSVPPVVTIDRPFMFFIRDLATGAILFVGRVVDPTA